ncbi:hypothetical protein EYF80_004433 [Liparis tanakae]|uniref:Uncharacterized protein n=1 Tax=Liparis tanakae TaxID=230148 RepID=A0A4Z2J660_9TELE|nr:hypothetical protein EYF80_004433 [Liparis tanakae]
MGSFLCEIGDGSSNWARSPYLSLGAVADVTPPELRKLFAPVPPSQNCDCSSEWQDVLLWVPLRGPVRGRAPGAKGLLATGRIHETRGNKCSFGQSELYEAKGCMAVSSGEVDYSPAVLIYLSQIPLAGRFGVSTSLKHSDTVPDRQHTSKRKL